MNGLPLVVLGVMFFTLAYSLLKVQSKIGEVSKAVNLGFKTIEDAINKNLVDPTGPMGGVSSAVDQNLKAIQEGISNSVLGSDGALEKINDTLNSTKGIADSVAAEIRSSRFLLTGTVAPIVGQSQSILYDIGTPLNDASATIHNIGNWIDVKILDSRPFQQLAKPFHDVATTVGSTGALCTTVGDKIGSIGGEITTVANKLDNVNREIISLQGQTESLRVAIDVTLRTGVTNFSNNLDAINSSIDGVLSAFKTGGEASLIEIGNARAFLDSALSKLVNKQWITLLLAAGMALILAGVSIGV
jgi:hypothetical protein